MKNNVYYTYILRCEDDSLYTGYTNDIKKRLKTHLNGKGAKYTRAHPPRMLVYLQKYIQKQAAMREEARIKKLTKRQKEELCMKQIHISDCLNMDDESISNVYINREKQIGIALVRWYGENCRDLPWRHSTEPYSIWLSEIMAQQTRVSTVIPYYHAFLARFPSVQALADAEEEAVLKKWEGLGYYSRARNLHKAAKQIVTQYDGRIPDNKKELETLAGIGDYTAAAIASIAFNQPEPAVDGNVLRVCSRMETSYEDIALPATKKKIADIIRRWMPVEAAGAFTQALMELGALVCTPKKTDCDICPVNAFCKAYTQGVQMDLPVKSAAKKTKPIFRAVALVQNCDGKWLVRRRTETLLHGLWEFPGWECPLEEAQVRMAKEMQNLGFRVASLQTIGSARHVFSHLTWDMEGIWIRLAKNADVDGYEWVSEAELQTKPWPTALAMFKAWTSHPAKMLR